MFSFSSNTIHPAGRGLPASERLGALLAVMLAVCMASLDTAIANTALPTIARDLQASDAGSIWVISGYQLAMVAGLLPAAALVAACFNVSTTHGAVIALWLGGLCAALASLASFARLRFGAIEPAETPATR